MPDGCTAIEITAENAMLMELDPSGKRGTYAIQIKLKYERRNDLWQKQLRKLPRGRKYTFI